MKNRNLIVFFFKYVDDVNLSYLFNKWTRLAPLQFATEVTYDELCQFYFQDWIGHVKSQIFNMSWYLLVRLVHDIKTENS